MEHIAISVIVPIYNTKPYLAECIESILAQKINVPIEVLLIDDGSTDGCGEVCDKSLPVMSACGSSIRRTRACPPRATPASTPPRAAIIPL